MDKVKSIYDSLFSLEHKKKGRRSYPIHKRLKFQGEYNDITEWIQDQFDIPNDARILDAGCGTGYTLLECCKHTKRSGIGISLSSREVHSANQSALRMNLAASCEFRVHDYALPLNEKFDVIIAIESLKHAPDLKRTLANLSGHLKSGGQFIFVEDFYIPNKVSASLGKTFLEKWSVSDLYDEAYYTDYLSELGLKPLKTQDFTSMIYKKRAWTTRAKITTTHLASHFLKGEKKELSHIYEGGLIMDYFYNKGAFEYKLVSFINEG